MSRYRAFISYVHSDNSNAIDRLHRGMARLAIPAYRVRGRPIFRDRTALKAQPNLWNSIATALSDSDFLILCATPDAAQSDWVQREVEYFLNSGKTLEDIIIVLLEGELAWQPAERGERHAFKGNALPQILQDRLDSEPLYVDLRWMVGKRKLSRKENQDFLSSVAGIVARLEGVEKDEVFGADIRYRQTAFGVASLTSLGLILLSVSLYYFSSLARDNAELAKKNEVEAVKQAELARDNEAEAKKQRDNAIANEVEAQRQAKEALAAYLLNQAQFSWQKDRLYGAATTAKLAATSHFLSQTPEAASLINQSMYFVAPEREDLRKTIRLLEPGTPFALGQRPAIFYSTDGGRVGKLIVNNQVDAQKSEIHVALQLANMASGDWQEFDLTENLSQFVSFGSIPGLFSPLTGKTRAHLANDGKSLALCIAEEPDFEDEKDFVHLIFVELAPEQQVIDQAKHELAGFYDECDFSFATNTFHLRTFGTENRTIIVATGDKLSQITVADSDGFISSSALSPDGQFVMATLQDANGAHVLNFRRSNNGQFEILGKYSLSGSTFNPPTTDSVLPKPEGRIENILGSITWSTNSKYFAIVERDTEFGFIRIGIYGVQKDGITYVGNDLIGDDPNPSILSVSDDGTLILALEQGKGLRLRDTTSKQDAFAISEASIRGGVLNFNQGALLYHTPLELHEVDASTTPGLVESKRSYGTTIFIADENKPPLFVSANEDLELTPFKDQLGATLWDFDTSEWYQIHLKSGPGEVVGVEFDEKGKFALISFDSRSFDDVICLASIPDRACIHTEKFRRTDFTLERSIGKRISSDGRYAYYTAEGDWSFEDDADVRDRITVVHRIEGKEFWVRKLAVPAGQNILGASLVDDNSVIVVSAVLDEDRDHERLGSLSLWKIDLTSESEELKIFDLGRVTAGDRSLSMLPVIASSTYEGKILLAIPTVIIDDRNVRFQIQAFDIGSGATKEIASKNNVVSVELNSSKSHLMILSSPDWANGPSIRNKLKFLKGGTEIDIVRLSDGRRVYSREFPNGFESAFFLPNEMSFRVTGLAHMDSKTIQDFVWRPTELIAGVCSFLGGGISRQYWKENVSSSIKYVNACN
ncbi:TIR domain-containing protein [Roseovarius aestuarii]|uniref:TIR domain-containing protein n=1 Tax=Roseovarius aestuarii TaxID=475083 RepID=A0A1X7BQA3_9RHOB|nr:TIR domain-containing protein [Roseovarius aestuarii]SMC11807.1 hypothetical protein ROA7745_01626 [Roseovarius aestuarii]